MFYKHCVTFIKINLLQNKNNQIAMCEMNFKIFLTKIRGSNITKSNRKFSILTKYI